MANFDEMLKIAKTYGGKSSSGNSGSTGNSSRFEEMLRIARGEGGSTTPAASASTYSDRLALAKSAGFDTVDAYRKAVDEYQQGQSAWEKQREAAKFSTAEAAGKEYETRKELLDDIDAQIRALKNQKTRTMLSQYGGWTDSARGAASGKSVDEQIAELESRRKALQESADEAAGWNYYYNEYLPGEQHWEEVHGAGTSGEQWYQASTAKAADLYRQIRALQDEKTAAAGMATDELSSEWYREYTADIDRKIEELSTQYQMAARSANRAGRYRYADIAEAPDFAEKSKAGLAAAEKARAQSDREALDYNERSGMFLSDNPTFDMARAIEIESYDLSYQQPTDEWSDEERGIYGYLYATDPERAKEYAVNLNNARAKAKRDKELEGVTEDVSFLEWLGARGAGLVSGVDYMQRAMEYAAHGYTKEPEHMTFTSFANAIDSAIAEDWNEYSGTIGEKMPVLGGKGLGDVYQLGMSMIDSVVSIAVGGEYGSLALFFGRAASSAYDEALERGASYGQALAVGFAQGAAEAAFEVFSVEKIIEMAKTGAKEPLKKMILEAGFTEGSEELATSMANLITDALISGDKSDFNRKVQQLMQSGMSYEEAYKQVAVATVGDLAYDALGGALSGAGHAVMAGGYARSRENAAAQETSEWLQERGYEQAEADRLAELDTQARVGYTQTDEQKQDVKKVEEERAAARKEVVGDIIERTAVITGTEITEKEKTALAGVYDYEKNGKDGEKFARAAVEAVQLGQSGAYATAEEARKASERGATLDAAQFREAFEIGEESGTRVTEQEFANKPTINGEAVEIAGVQDGKVLVKQGGEVRAAELSDVEGLSDSYRALVEAASKTETGSEMLAAYDAGQNVKAYARAWNVASGLYGAQTDMTVEKARKAGRNSLRILTDAQLKAALEAGRKIEKTQERATREALTGKVGFYEGGKLEGVEYDAVTEKEARKLLGKDEMALLEALTDFVNVTLVKSKTDKSGNYQGAQGIFYRNGHVYLDVNAGMISKKSGERTIVLTAAHELTHFIRAYNEEGYKALRSFITDELADQGLSLERLARQKMDRSGRQMDYDEAVEEVVADACETMLTDPSKLKDFANENPEAANAVLKWLNEFLDKLRNTFARKTQHVEAEAMQERIDELRKLWYEALGQATLPTYEAEHPEGKAKYSTRTEALAVDGVDWMDDFSSIKEQLEKHRDDIIAMDPVVEITYAGEDKKALENLVLEPIPRLGGKRMIRNGLSFEFDKKGAHSIVLHAKSPELRAASLAAPFIAKRGKLIAGQRNHENTNMTTLTYAAPAIINGQPVNIGLAIQFTSDGRPRAVNVETESGGIFKINKTAQGLRSRTGKSQVLQLLTRAVSDNTITSNRKKINTQNGSHSDRDTEAVRRQQAKDRGRQERRHERVLAAHFRRGRARKPGVLSERAGEEQGAVKGRGRASGGESETVRQRKR